MITHGHRPIDAILGFLMRRLDDKLKEINE